VRAGRPGCPRRRHRHRRVDPFGAEACLCGPPPILDAEAPLLEATGVAAEGICFDRFLPAREPRWRPAARRRPFIVNGL
jgi:ferredoxin-NADP reductase